jgi:uncharacterized protein (DUF433 family)
MTTVPLEYIEVDDRGSARLIGTGFKVRLLVGAMRADDLSAADLVEQFPDLRLDQVHAALAYYYANKDEIDRQLDEAARYADEMRAKNPNRYTRAELVARFKAMYPGRPVPGEDEPAGP